MARRTFPDYEEFSARAKAFATGIPQEFLEGVEDVVVHRERKAHPLMDEVVTLGECEPSRLVWMTGGEATRSIVHIYYGSFRDLASRDDGFDTERELEETIRHEIQHHLEDRAGVRTLIDEDDLDDAHHRFAAGLENPKGWWRRGRRLERGVYAVGDDLFVELRLRAVEFEARRGTVVELSVLGEDLEAEIPKDATPGEILTYEGEGLLVEEEGHSHAHAHDRPKSKPRRDTAGGEDGEEVVAGDLHLVLDVG